MRDNIIRLLPNGSEILALALGLLVLFSLWRLVQQLVRGRARPPTQRHHLATSGSPWWGALWLRLYACSVVLVIVTLSLALRIPLSVHEPLATSSSTGQPVTLRWGTLPINELSCVKPPQRASEAAATQTNQLCPLPSWLQPKLSAYQPKIKRAPTVFENGVGFWGLRSSIDSVAQGLGRFHLESATGVLTFSASDATPPALNGRAYQIRYTATLAPAYLGAGLFFCLPALLWLGRRFTGQGYSRQAGLSQPTALAVLIGAALVLVLVLQPLWQIWLTSDSRFGIAGVLPWSDASAWFNGFHQFLTFGQLESWTVRRPLNPPLMSVLLQLTQLDWEWTLVVRALLLGGTLATFIWVLARYFGWLPALAALGLGAAFASDFIPVALTETQGLIFALAGFAWLIRGAQEQRLGAYATGAMLVSIAMMLRLGPAGMLVTIALWPVFTLGRESRWQWFGVTGFCLLVGPGLTLLVTQLWYPGTNLPAANFAYTFYGLAFGGEPWTLFGQHYPALAGRPDAEVSRVVWQAAFAQVQAHPYQLLQGFLLFCENYIQYFFTYLSTGVRPFATAVFLVGLVSSLLQWRNRLATFLLFCYAGVLATVPVIYWSLDAYRAFAVSLPITMALLAAGCHALLQLPAWRWQSHTKGNIDQIHPTTVSLLSPKRVAAVIAASSTLLLLMLVTVGPGISVGSQTVEEARQTHHCTGPAERPFMLDIGRSSPWLQIRTNPTLPTWQEQINSQEFRFDPTFYRNEMAAQLATLQPGDALIHAFDLTEPFHSNEETSRQAWIVLPQTLVSNGTTRRESLDGFHYLCAIAFDTSEASNRYRIYRATGIRPANKQAPAQRPQRSS